MRSELDKIAQAYNLMLIGESEADQINQPNVGASAVGNEDNNDNLLSDPIVDARRTAAMDGRSFSEIRNSPTFKENLETLKKHQRKFNMLKKMKDSSSSPTEQRQLDRALTAAKSELEFERNMLYRMSGIRDMSSFKNKFDNHFMDFAADNELDFKSGTNGELYKATKNKFEKSPDIPPEILIGPDTYGEFSRNAKKVKRAQQQ